MVPFEHYLFVLHYKDASEAEMNNTPVLIQWSNAYVQYLDTHKEYMKINNIEFICWGPEFCPKTGRPHLQGYI